MLSLLRTIRPLDQAIARLRSRSRAGRTSRPFMTVDLIYLIRAGAGPAGSTTSRAGRAGIAVFAHIALSLFQGCRTWFISGSNKALATAPFPSGMVGRFLKPQIRAQHERPGFVTA